MGLSSLSIRTGGFWPLKLFPPTSPRAFGKHWSAGSTRTARLKRPPVGYFLPENCPFPESFAPRPLCSGTLLATVRPGLSCNSLHPINLLSRSQLTPPYGSFPSENSLIPSVVSFFHETGLCLTLSLQVSHFTWSEQN